MLCAVQAGFLSEVGGGNGRGSSRGKEEGDKGKGEKGMGKRAKRSREEEGRREGMWDRGSKRKEGIERGVDRKDWRTLLNL